MIRPVEVSDAKFMLELVNSDGFIRNIGDRNITNETEAEEYIRNVQNKLAFFYNVFELKDSQKAIGIVSFMKRDDEVYPDFGFAMLPQYGKKGYALEASQKYLEELIHSKKYPRIIAITKPHNNKSIGLLKKLGFEYVEDYQKDGETVSLFRLA